MAQRRKCIPTVVRSQITLVSHQSINPINKTHAPSQFREPSSAPSASDEGGDGPDTLLHDLLIPMHKLQRTRQQQQQQQSQQPPRSKSSDILKNSHNTSSAGGDLSAGKSQTFSFNSLKQWGKNRLRMKVRSMGADAMDQSMTMNATTNATNSNHSVDGFAKKATTTTAVDLDDFNVHDIRRSGGSRPNTDRALSHERKPSYSSSERSLPLSISSLATSAATTSPTLPASINPVKMRESAAIRRQRRMGLGYKEEPNNSSSGNWSASSESGRTSIGSEITVQPKSSASSNSLNHMNHPGSISGPPSSVISRRRFFNTSASSSVTSEGTATPEQMQELMFDDMETCSAYSCDTEGYYTSFHVDSGLKTLKEEEPSTPLHISSALSSTNSFSSGNQTVVENEYELFGRGSTSTTASSAGTICTTLMMGNGCGSDRSSFNGVCGGGGPSVPERKSSLTKLDRSNSTTSSNRNSMEPLERSRSSSTMGSASTLDRMGTIKRNGVLLPKETVAGGHKNATNANANGALVTKADVRLDSPDSGNNTSTSPVDSNPHSISPPGVRSGSEFEYSESSDLENMDRSERIRTKTTINSSRIPSMCVITPSNSDDEGTQHSSGPQHSHNTSGSSSNASSTSIRAKLATPLMNEKRKKLLIETDLDQLDYPTPAVIVNDLKEPPQVQHVKKTTLLPLNTVFGRLKGVLPHLNRKSPLKSPGAAQVAQPEQIYDVAGEYVTISDAKNLRKAPNSVYYANDIVKNNLATVLSGNLNDETEYVSLNELPGIHLSERTRTNSGAPVQNKSTAAQNSTLASPVVGGGGDGSNNNNNNNSNSNVHGARVKLDAQGKVIYNSDSLRRRKGAHTTFAPGPCVKPPASSVAEEDEYAYIEKRNNGGLVQQARTPIQSRSGVLVLGQKNAEPSPKIDNSISANRNILATGRLIKQSPSGVVVSADKGLQQQQHQHQNQQNQQNQRPNSVPIHATHPQQSTGVLGGTSGKSQVAPLSPLEEEEGLHLLKMIPNSMGPLKNSGAYSTLPKLGSPGVVAQQQQQLPTHPQGKRPLLRIIDNLQTHCKSSCVNNNSFGVRINNNNNNHEEGSAGQRAEVDDVEDAEGYSLLALSNLTSNHNSSSNLSHHHYHLPQFKQQHPSTTINPNLSKANGVTVAAGDNHATSFKCAGGNLVRRNSYRRANDEFDLDDETFMATLESQLILPRYLAGLRDAASVGSKLGVVHKEGFNGVNGRLVVSGGLGEEKAGEEDEGEDEESDGDEDDYVYITRGTIPRKQVLSPSAAASAVLSPQKVIIPADRYQHRAKFLETNSPANNNNKRATVADTDIW